MLRARSPRLRLLSLMLSNVSSMMFVGLKLGGNERGGKSLNVITNCADVVHRAVDLADVVQLPVPEGVGRNVGPLERIL